MSEKCKHYARLLLETKDALHVLGVMAMEHSNCCTFYNYINRVRNYIMEFCADIVYDHEETLMDAFHKFLDGSENYPEGEKERFRKILQTYLSVTPIATKRKIHKWQDPVFHEPALDEILFDIPLFPDWFEAFKAPEKVINDRRRLNTTNTLYNARNVPVFQVHSEKTKDPVNAMEQILMNPSSYCIQSNVMALVFVTGRRPVEILKTGIFNLPWLDEVEGDDNKDPLTDLFDVYRDYELSFSGKVKSKLGKSNRYIIKTLIPAAICLTAIQDLRSRLPNIPNLSNERVNSIYSKGYKIKEYFGSGFTFMKLRGANALLTKRMFPRESSTMSVTAWTAQQLCHDGLSNSPYYLSVNVDAIPLRDMEKESEFVFDTLQECIEDWLPEYTK